MLLHFGNLFERHRELNMSTFSPGIFNRYIWWEVTANLAGNFLVNWRQFYLHQLQGGSGDTLTICIRPRSARSSNTKSPPIWRWGQSFISWLYVIFNAQRATKITLTIDYHLMQYFAVIIILSRHQLELELETRIPSRVLSL